MTRPSFGLLMPMWGGDRPDRAEAAIRSATLEQDLPPEIIVLSVDGPLDAALDRLVARIGDGEFGEAIVLRHRDHRGLARTLQDGLEAMPAPIVARADADDLCRPERFARQIPFFREHGLDLLGSAMQEFSDEVAPGTGPKRSRPLTQAEIEKYLPTHSPFHHPTVVMKRETALAVAGYRELPLLEDYWLWERMMLGGARMANLPDVLVDYRVDADLFARRGGFTLIGSDLRLQRIMHRDGVTSTAQAVRNMGMRLAYRLAPGGLRRIGYRHLVESRTPTGEERTPPSPPEAPRSPGLT